MTLPPPYAKPALLATVDALRTTDARYPWVGPSVDESAAAEQLEAIEAAHPAGADESDTGDYFGTWGNCQGCGEPWPCEPFLAGQQAATYWLGRAADRVMKHANQVERRRAS